MNKSRRNFPIDDCLKNESFLTETSLHAYCRLSDYISAIVLAIIKVLAKIIDSENPRYLEQRNLIHDRLYGFLRQRSTADLQSYGEASIIAKAFNRV